MALDLNKGGDDTKSQPESQKKGLNLSKTSGGSSGNFNLSKQPENFADQKESKTISDSTQAKIGEVSRSPGGSKKLLWVFAIAAIAVIIGFFWLNSKKSDGPSGAGTQDEVAQSVIDPSKEIQNDVLDASQSDLTAAEEETSPQEEITQSEISSISSTPSSTESETSSSGNQPVSVTITGTLEEKALRVIRGDFGNGIERINALGADYAVIQSKVNEMYRKGLVN